MSSELPTGPSPEDGGSDKDRDPMGPPEEPCECFCLHCRRTFMSDQIWLQRVRNARDGFEGFWMCPTPNCTGAGFTIDIFPTDPEHPANEGWHWDDEDDEDDEEAFDETGEWDEGEEEEVEEHEGWSEETGTVAEEWNPEEPEYKSSEGALLDDGDLEGEEWKYGLSPGEVPQVEPPPPGVEPRNWMEEEALYNAPDRRPREIDLPEREEGDSTSFNEDDIPF